MIITCDKLSLPTHELANVYDFSVEKSCMLSSFGTIWETKKLSEGIRTAIVSKHKISKGYIAVSKDFGIPASRILPSIKASRTSLMWGKEKEKEN